MKIIHSYLPIKPYKISKQNIYLMTLSMLLAKKYYEKVVLYTNVETADIVRKIGLPYDEIDDILLEGIDVGTFSIPKLIVYSVQTEPYIHIDIDTFLFKKINFKIDGGVYSTLNEGIETFKMDWYGESFYSTYIKSAFHLIKKLPKEFSDEVNFSEILNMSIFGGYNYKLISDATIFCLKIYDENKDFFDSNYYYACVIEQLFISAAMRMIITENKYDEKFNFLFGRNIPNYINISDSENCPYPIEITSNDEKVIINNDLELNDFILYNFNGFLHIGGYKEFDKLLFLFRSRILIEFNGSIFLEKINQIFTERFDFEKDDIFYKNLIIKYDINKIYKKFI